MPGLIHLEVCVESAAAGLAAVAAGATRIELNTALHLDGLTANIEDCRQFKAACDAELVAMVRPHARSFFYTADDNAQAITSCENLLAAGVDGIVFGSLDAEQRVDLIALNRIKRTCGDRPLVFHRAFDQVADQLEAMEQLIDHGVQRILTSGGSKTALEGAGQLRQLVEQSRGRIEILPGGGVSADNGPEIIRLSGCNQLHGSFRATSQDPARPDTVAIQRLLAAFHES